MSFDFETGEVILIDKPYGWTSFDVVAKIRGRLRIKKIGHAGTLDPLATGLLILCTGKFTKKIDEYQAQEKEYSGELILGKTTPSVDLETDFDSENDTGMLTESMVRSKIRKFLGTIDQIPPSHSAVKINGERAYSSARQGIAIEIKPRKVFIKEFTLPEINIPSVRFNVVCSKGTYIRSLVRDFGDSLQVGAYMNSLRRERSGNFTVNEAISPDDFIEKVKQSR